MTDIQSTPTPGNADERKLRKLRVALIWSLAVNLLVLGLILGAVLNFNKSGGERANTVDGPNPFLRALNREDARKLRAVMSAELGSPGDRRAETRASTQALLTALRADTFAPDAVTQAYQALNMATQRRLDIGQRAVLDHLLSLDADGRADFADRLEDALRRGPRGGEGGRPDGPHQDGPRMGADR